MHIIIEYFKDGIVFQSVQEEQKIVLAPVIFLVYIFI